MAVAANELGESFRPVAPRLVVPSYCVSFMYVAVDTWDKASTELARPGGGSASAAAAGVDTLLWPVVSEALRLNHS